MTEISGLGEKFQVFFIAEILYLRYFLDDREYSLLLKNIELSFSKLKEQLNVNAFDKVRSETGIKNLNILTELSNIHKTIDYNRFEPN